MVLVLDFWIAHIIPPITKHPPTAWYPNKRSPRKKMAKHAPKIGMRFRKIAARFTPTDRIAAFQRYTAKTVEPTPRYPTALNVTAVHWNDLI
jgi:hypothetical protein